MIKYDITWGMLVTSFRQTHWYLGGYLGAYMAIEIIDLLTQNNDFP